MKKFSLLFVILAMGLSLAASPAIQSGKIYWGKDLPAGWTGNWPEKFLTVSEKTGFEETSSAQQILEFINALQWNSENISVFDLFTSELGRVCPVVVLANPRITSPEEAKASGKPVVFILGGIHPGEYSGKEADLMIMRDILLGDKKHLLDNQIILICPNFNVDGNEARSTTAGLPKFRGQRANALGFDLNRDAIKLETNSVRKLNENVFNRWDPFLIYDTHHMGGMKHAYPIVYTASTVPTAGAEPRDYLVQSLFPAVRGNVKDKWGLEIFFHCGTNGDREGTPWPPTVWSHDYAAWTTEGKFVVAAYGLRNRMSILCESNGTNTSEKHVYSQYAYVHELLEYTNVHGREMAQICREADKATVDKVLAKAESGQLKNWVEGKYESRGKVDLLLYPEIIQEYIPGTSIRRIQPGLLEKGPVLYRGIEDLTKPVGIKEATMPRGYLIPAGLAGIAEKLRVHGIKVEVLEIPVRASGEEFIVDRLAGVQKGGYTMMKLDGRFRPIAAREFPAGTYRVDLAQPLADLAFYCLEPEVGDGFAGWGLFNDYLRSLGVENNSVAFPVFKYLKIIE
ncbi:MAG: M14 family zinc carboxypeptidase [Candidatus Aminicenantales bacterium]